MKYILLLCFILAAVFTVTAQETYTIKRDTVNISGYIYDAAGKPMRLVKVNSKAKDPTFNTYPLGAISDENGYFELKGACFSDTLTIYNLYGKMICPTHGSRYIEINLPWTEQIPINPDDPVIVSAKRATAKRTTLLKLNLRQILQMPVISPLLQPRSLLEE